MADADDLTERERREAARAEREATERRHAAGLARRKRLGVLGAILAAAAVLVVVLLLATGGSSDSPAPTTAADGALPGQAETTRLLQDIPQRGRFLGDPEAPVTLVEFADIQCPFCRDFTQQALPTIIRDYVRPGKVRLEFRPRIFLGPDSEKAAKTIVAAGRANKLWNALELFYASQGAENSGWVTDALVSEIVTAVGLDPAAVAEQAQAPGVAADLKAADLLATRNGLDSTPSFLLGKTGRPGTPLAVQELSGAFFSQALDQALGS